MKKFLCIIGIHNYIEIKSQQLKVSMGLPHGLPCHRITEKCLKCGKVNYYKTNLGLPTKDLYNEFMWKD